MRVVCLAWALVYVPLHVWAQRSPAAEEVEAAYLYQFGRYVDWPADRQDNSDTFFICVLGTDPFGATLDETVAGRVIGGGQVAVRRIAGPDESQGCRILFVSPSEESRMPEVLKALEGTGVLTVGRGPTFTRQGGMIAFTFEGRKVRFVVNLAATDAEALTLSSQLLRVAGRVEK